VSLGDGTSDAQVGVVLEGAPGEIPGTFGPAAPSNSRRTTGKGVDVKRSQRVGLALLAGGLALTATGCARDEAQMCEHAEGAEFCLTEDRLAYKAAGEGFRPGSSIEITSDGGAGATTPSSPFTLHAGADGKVPSRNASTGILTGSSPQRVTVTGTSSTGKDVRFEFTVPASEN
jgi:hypothetical protein